MANTIIVRCEQCGRANEIDARRGGECEACGHLLIPPTPSQQQPFQQQQIPSVPQSPIQINIGGYPGQVTPTTNSVSSFSSCVGSIVSLVIVGSILLVAGFAIFGSESIEAPSFIESLSQSIGVSTSNVPDLRVSLLAESDFGGVDAMALSPDGRWLTYSEDAGIRIYDLQLNRLVGTITIGNFSASGLGFSADSTHLFSNEGSSIREYNIETRQLVREYDETLIGQMLVNSAGTYASVRLVRDDVFAVMDLTTFEIVAQVPEISNLGLPTVFVSAESDYAMIIHSDAYRLVDLERNRDILLGFNKVNSAAWSAEEDILYVSADGGVHQITITEGVPTVERQYTIPQSIYTLSSEPIATSYSGDSVVLILTGITEFYRYDAADSEAKGQGKTQNFIREMVVTEDFVITADVLGRIQRWDNP